MMLILFFWLKVMNLYHCLSKPLYHEHKVVTEYLYILFFFCLNNICNDIFTWQLVKISEHIFTKNNIFFV